MQNSRHLQILRDINLVRKTLNMFPHIGPIVFPEINKVVHDLDIAVLKHDMQMRIRSSATQIQIKSSIERAKRPILDCFVGIVAKQLATGE